jgi:hypothetical protein
MQVQQKPAFSEIMPRQVPIECRALYLFVSASDLSENRLALFGSTL